jgi:hypothetical protein
MGVIFEVTNPRWLACVDMVDFAGKREFLSLDNGRPMWHTHSSSRPLDPEPGLLDAKAKSNLTSRAYSTGDSSKPFLAAVARERDRNRIKDTGYFLHSHFQTKNRYR